MGRGELKGFRRLEEAISIVFPAGGHHERQQLAPEDIAPRSYQATVPTTTKLIITRPYMSTRWDPQSLPRWLARPLTDGYTTSQKIGRTRHDLPTECLTADESPSQIFLERQNIMLNKVKRVSTYPRRLWWDLEAEDLLAECMKLMERRGRPYSAT